MQTVRKDRAVVLSMRIQDCQHWLGKTKTWTGKVQTRSMLRKAQDEYYELTGEYHYTDERRNGHNGTALHS